MLSGMSESGRDLLPCRVDFSPNRLREPHILPRSGRVRRAHDRSFRSQARKYRDRQVLSDFVETQASSLMLCIAPTRAEGRNMVVAIDHYGAIEVRGAVRV